jgi:hypothetical protein
MTDRNCSDCKDVEISTHRVGSIGASSRRTMFIRGTNTNEKSLRLLGGTRTSKQTKMKRGNKNMITKNYITQEY